MIRAVRMESDASSGRALPQCLVCPRGGRRELVVPLCETLVSQSAVSAGAVAVRAKRYPRGSYLMCLALEMFASQEQECTFESI